MSGSDYSLPNSRAPYASYRDSDNAFDYTPYASESRFVTFGTNIITRVVVMVLSLILFIFAILGLVLDLAGFDIKLDYGFITARIPLERYKAFTFSQVYAGSPTTGNQPYTGKDKTAMSAAEAFLIIAVLFSFGAFVLSIVLIALRVVYERRRSQVDEERESERLQYKRWLSSKRQRREALQREGRSTVDVDAERYPRSVPPSKYADDENHRRRIDQNVGIALFALLIVAVFAFFMTLVLFAALFFFRYVSISSTDNVATVYLAGFWLVLVALILAVVAVVLVAINCLSGVCVCASHCQCCSNTSSMVHTDGTAVDEPTRNSARSRGAAGGQPGSGSQGSNNPMSPDHNNAVAAAGAMPAKSVYYPPRSTKRVSDDSEMHGFDAVKKKNHSDQRDATSAQVIPTDSVMVAQGLPMALPGPPVPAGCSAADLQRALQSGSQPSSAEQPRSNNTGYEYLGLPAPQYQVPQSYQPTTQRQPPPRGDEEL